MVKNCCVLFCLFFFLQSVSFSQKNCCCGTIKELNFPGFDFEFPPDPPFWGSNTYCPGPFGPWTVTKSCVDHVDPNQYNVGAGNPNGKSYFVDLFGGPLPSGPFASGTIQYPLTGLTPGYLYTLEWYYAKFNVPTPQNIKGNVKVANGAWLDVSWKATNNGDVIWLKASYQFTAQASSTTLKFSDAGSTAPGWPSGMLIDDIHLYECPNDIEKPVINNPPENVLVACNSDVPDIPKLDVSDNCDPNPKVTFKENTNVINPCTKKITRDWTITDACGNIQTAEQIIDVSDPDPPAFTKLPVPQFVACDKDIAREFNIWIKNNGGATATDDCTFTWSASYNHIPSKSCEDVLVEFIAKDYCGNVSSEFAHFTVLDTSAPKFIVKAVNKNMGCIPNPRDSLRIWLQTLGFSVATDNCDAVYQSSNFNGDSTKNPLNLTFYAQDLCGNIDSCKASFSYQTKSDTFRITNLSCNFLQNSIDTSSFNLNGCDSIVILQKIKLLPDSIYIQSNTCDAQQHIFDTLRLVNKYGCDSLVFYKFILQPKAITNLQNMDCAYTKYSKDTMLLNGQYCDSLIITEFIPLRKDSSTVILNTCDKSKVNTTVLSLINNVGCDSIVTIFTVYNPQQITLIDKKVCGLFKTFVDTMKFATGLCDSLVITTNIPLPIDTTYIQSTSCNKLNTGVFSNHFFNQFGCDSLVIKEILLNPSDSTFISKSTCILSQSGISIRPLKNRFGCDSIIQTTTDFIPSDTIRIIQNTCKLSNAGIDTLVFTGTTCDSVVFITTVFIPSDTTQISKTTCDLASAGLKTLVLKGSICDSVVYINTVLIPSDTTQINQTSCDLTKSGLSTMLLQNMRGCDSLLLINTKYIPLHLLFNLDSITCFNQHDGIFRILNSSDFGTPFELFINNNKLGNQNQITNLSAGTYEIYIRDKNGCVTDSVQFTLSNPPALLIDLGNDLEVKKGSNIKLNLQSNRIVQNIFWQPSNLTNCNNCNQINFVADKDIWVYAQAIDNRNCNQTDSIFIRVKKSSSVYAPNSFSPNGDNINDYFYIQGADNAIVEILFIYDRWGNKVFETQNVPVNLPTAGWNGTFNSQKMNAGVFVYYAKVRKDDQEIVELKGDLTLIR